MNVTGYAHPDGFAVHPPSNARFQSGIGAVLFLPPHYSVSDCKDMAQELDLIGSYLDPLTVTSSVHERVLFCLFTAYKHGFLLSILYFALMYTYM